VYLWVFRIATELQILSWQRSLFLGHMPGDTASHGGSPMIQSYDVDGHTDAFISGSKPKGIVDQIVGRWDCTTVGP